MAGTLITSEVDFEASGKHSGFLRVPHSVHRSAYGWIPVPVVSIKNGDGPTLLIMAGNHGDEYEGQIAVSNHARKLEHADLSGQLILLPMVNFPAAQAGLRTSPIEDDLPYAWVFKSGGGRTSTAHTAMSAANRNGVINVMAELGGDGEVTPDILLRAEHGLHRVLHALDMLPSYRPDTAQGTRELNVQGSIFAYTAGLFEPLKSIGEEVSIGEVVGRIHHPDTAQSEPEIITSPHEGIALCRRAMAQVVCGDAMLQIASDARPRAV